MLLNVTAFMSFILAILKMLDLIQISWLGVFVPTIASLVLMILLYVALIILKIIF